MDDKGLRVARQAGWIISYKSVEEYMDSNCVLDWKFSESIEKQLAIFPTSLSNCMPIEIITR